MLLAHRNGRKAGSCLETGPASDGTEEQFISRQSTSQVPGKVSTD